MAERLESLPIEYWRRRAAGDARFDFVNVSTPPEEIEAWLADKPGQYLLRDLSRPMKPMSGVVILDPDTALEFKLRFA